MIAFRHCLISWWSRFTIHAVQTAPCRHVLTSRSRSGEANSQPEYAAGLHRPAQPAVASKRIDGLRAHTQG